METTTEQAAGQTELADGSEPELTKLQQQCPDNQPVDEAPGDEFAKHIRTLDSLTVPSHNCSVDMLDQIVEVAARLQAAHRLVEQIVPPDSPAQALRERIWNELDVPYLSQCCLNRGIDAQYLQEAMERIAPSEDRIVEAIHESHAKVPAMHAWKALQQEIVKALAEGGIETSKLKFHQHLGYGQQSDRTAYPGWTLLYEETRMEQRWGISNKFPFIARSPVPVKHDRCLGEINVLDWKIMTEPGNGTWMLFHLDDERAFVSLAPYFDHWRAKYNQFYPIEVRCYFEPKGWFKADNDQTAAAVLST